MLEFLYCAVAVVIILFFGLVYLMADELIADADPTNYPRLAKRTPDDIRNICVQYMFCAVVWPVLLVVSFVMVSIRKSRAK